MHLVKDPITDSFSNLAVANKICLGRRAKLKIIIISKVVNFLCLVVCEFSVAQLMARVVFAPAGVQLPPVVQADWWLWVVAVAVSGACKCFQRCLRLVALDGGCGWWLWLEAVMVALAMHVSYGCGVG
jgi:hypothetical protein